jgi:hypothetical protein
VAGHQGRISRDRRLRLPAGILRDAEMREADEVIVSRQGDTIVVRLADPSIAVWRRRYKNALMMSIVPVDDDG